MWEESPQARPCDKGSPDSCAEFPGEAILRGSVSSFARWVSYLRGGRSVWREESGVLCPPSGVVLWSLPSALVEEDFVRSGPPGGCGGFEDVFPPSVNPRDDFPSSGFCQRQRQRGFRLAGEVAHSAVNLDSSHR
ncbi:unnamed protein product [Microthlaspi erraticum]|uniref:Uncharacterized protein n=1 Tax=Microthlaspi erraticum TaxID=1685480 RepID=A0A6D2JC25_9BRAS|nr:unnamed protein product [Microthlaspi erraticum]